MDFIEKNNFVAPSGVGAIYRHDRLGHRAKTGLDDGSVQYTFQNLPGGGCTVTKAAQAMPLKINEEDRNYFARQACHRDAHDARKPRCWQTRHLSWKKWMRNIFEVSLEEEP